MGVNMTEEDTTTEEVEEKPKSKSKSKKKTKPAPRHWTQHLSRRRKSKLRAPAE